MSNELSGEVIKIIYDTHRKVNNLDGRFEEFAKGHTDRAERLETVVENLEEEFHTFRNRDRFKECPAVEKIPWVESELRSKANREELDRIDKNARSRDKDQDSEFKWNKSHKVNVVLVIVTGISVLVSVVLGLLKVLGG